MGLLGDFTSMIDAAKRRAGLLVTDPAAFGNLARNAVDDSLRPFYDAAQQSQSVFPEDQRQARDAMLNASMGLLSPLQTVWHGSPHLFDKFDASKIGTGEGAQAYGHGLYFAENPNVAREYAPLPINITPTRPIAEAEQDAWSKAYSTMIQQGGDASASIKSLENQAKIWQRKGANNPMDADAAKWQLPRIKQAIEMLQSGVAKSVKVNGLYKVDLPDEMIPKMLDWDKPLSQQAPEVRDAVRAAGSNLSDKWPGMHHLWSIQRKYGGATQGRGPASDALAEQGIPGIRYLDAGSRGAGQGTYNYVVFPGNEGLLKILERQ